MCDMLILIFHNLVKQAPTIGSKRIGNILSHDQILAEIKQDILIGSSLICSSCEIIIHFKTDCSRQFMGVSLYHADVKPETQSAEVCETRCGKCLFDMTKSSKNMSLHPLSFAERSNTKDEKNYHSFVGEVSLTLC